jgi:hypothetical protein
MAKQIVTPKPKQVKPKTKKTGNSKKPVARSAMIVDRNELQNMTSSEIVKNLNRIDFDKTVDYKAQEYQRAKGSREMTEALIMITPDGVEHFIGQKTVDALGTIAESDPIGFALQFIAAKRGNPYLAK